MITRSLLAIAAASLAAVAAAVASLDGDADIVPFFVTLTLAGGVGAWAIHEPYRGLGACWAVASAACGLSQPAGSAFC